MDKKDIYEHLAKIYLDASSKRKKKKPINSQLFRNLFLVSIVFIFILSGLLFSSANKKDYLTSEVALFLALDPLKINFNFDPAKKETYSLALNKLDLNRYKTLAFSVRKLDYKDTITLRVEFTNIYKERSEVYLRDIPRHWQDFRIDLSRFKTITDWSEMLSLAFVVEQWNATGKKGVVLIDNVRLLK